MVSPARVLIRIPVASLRRLGGMRLPDSRPVDPIIPLWHGDSQADVPLAGTTCGLGGRPLYLVRVPPYPALFLGRCRLLARRVAGRGNRF
jgi:hypothetical protein